MTKKGKSQEEADEEYCKVELNSDEIEELNDLREPAKPEEDQNNDNQVEEDDLNEEEGVGDEESDMEIDGGPFTDDEINCTSIEFTNLKMSEEHQDNSNYEKEIEANSVSDNSGQGQINQKYMFANLGNQCFATATLHALLQLEPFCQTLR